METISHIGVFVPKLGSSEHNQSDPALAEARQLAEQTGAKVTVFCPANAVESSDLDHEPLAGPIANALREAVVEHEIDILLKTARPGRKSERVIGRLARSLLRNCPCPVWIVRPKQAGSPPVIAAVGAIDYDSPPAELTISRRVIAVAATIAQLQSRPLVVTHVSRDDQMRYTLIRDWREEYIHRIEYRRWIYGRLARFAEKVTDMPVLIEPLTGNPVRAIVELGQRLRSDTIVVGHQMRSGLRAMLFGNTGETVVDESDANVISVNAR